MYNVTKTRNGSITRPEKCMPILKYRTTSNPTNMQHLGLVVVSCGLKQAWTSLTALLHATPMALPWLVSLINFSFPEQYVFLAFLTPWVHCFKLGFRCRVSHITYS